MGLALQTEIGPANPGGQGQPEAPLAGLQPTGHGARKIPIGIDIELIAQQGASPDAHQGPGTGADHQIGSLGHKPLVGV